MPVVSTVIDPNLGPVLDVLIGFDPNYRSGAPLTLPPQQLRALLDTGATISSVDERLARTLNLTVVNSVKQTGIGGEVECDVCLAQIEVPSPAGRIQWTLRYLAASGRRASLLCDTWPGYSQILHYAI